MAVRKVKLENMWSRTKTWVENVMENLTRVGWMYVMGNRWRAEEEACAA